MLAYESMRSQSLEVLGLAVAAALGLVHIVLASHATSLRRGYRWAAGPRDDVLPPLSGVAGRLARASSNFLETFPFFAAAVLAVLATNSQSSWSRSGVLLLPYGARYLLSAICVRSVHGPLAGVERCYNRCRHNLCLFICLTRLFRWHLAKRARLAKGKG